MKKQLLTAALLVVWLLARPVHADEPLLTVAESSNFRATSRHADVVAFCERLAKQAPLVRLGELGTSFEKRKLPLLILADPPIATPEQAADSGKLVVFAMGNIHAGEVDGKEGLLMLARDLATAKERPLLKHLILVIAPIFNADGNERFSKSNRPGQAGPEEGMGIRANAQQLDLNRDFVKLESPEVRALVRFCTRWDPAILIDCHTTNGSYHRYTLTYEGPRNPAGDERVIAGVRDQLLPDAGRRLEKHTDFKSFFYGNYNREHTRWESVPPTPRYGIHYFGLRNRMAILSESYSYASYHDRVLASRDFVRSIFEYAGDHHDQIRKLLAEARQATVRAGNQPQPSDRIALRQKAAPLNGPVDFLGFVEERKDGRRRSTGEPKEYRLEYFGRNEPTLLVQRPYAYLFPASLTGVVENLQRHGIQMDELREDIDLDVESYHITRIERASSVFQKHRQVSLDATSRRDKKRLQAGTIVVRTGQSLGTLAAYLLEPQSEDGLCTWNFFDEALAESKDFPVLRLPQPVPLTTGRVRPLAEERTMNKPFLYQDLATPRSMMRFNGDPVKVEAWLDGEHFLQIKEGRLYKVHASSGRPEPFLDPDKLAKGLASLPGFTKQRAASLARQTTLQMNPQHTGALFEQGNDLYFCKLDGSGAVRLTKTPGRKELATFSPDGKYVAYVREQNLCVVDLATQSERRLTTDGSALVGNGKADWVYGEEIFNRHHKAYWWSPDSGRLVFLRFDDTPVHKFTVIDEIPTRQVVETVPYPKAGDANPLIKLGVVPVSGGPVAWADLGSYAGNPILIVRAGWTPDSQKVFFYVQNRVQTWLDFCTCSNQAGPVTPLFRETTRAWVDDPGEPTFLKDGSFLLASERTGWKHLYHFGNAGKLLGPVTSGDWEVQALQQVDEKTGWVYFTARRESPIATDLYRVKVAGSAVERLTPAPGDQRVLLGPGANYFVATHSDHTRPDQVHLYAGDGAPVRTLDTNPVYLLEEYRFGQSEQMHIKTPDGFVLEGSLLRPADFDPGKRYPVWFMTYAGPHAPTIHERWSLNQLRDQVLAQLGFLVFRCDPRSASGKGACSAWSAYRQLGVQELKDIETAIHWLTAHPYVDSKRIGMSGHSYGGFMTAYALTHSQLFAAGIAGAPVTDWRNYDSIYTERYMNTPQDNPQGYNLTSVVKAAPKLHGKLLIVHGIMDDNVHMQNSVQLIQELQQANKDNFEVMFYPHSRHPIMSRHYQRLMIEFMQRALGMKERME